MMLSRPPLDYPGKKHMIIITDDNGKPVGYVLMTIDEQRKSQLRMKRGK